jgi:hypothetical protein
MFVQGTFLKNVPPLSEVKSNGQFGLARIGQDEASVPRRDTFLHLGQILTVSTVNLREPEASAKRAIPIPCVFILADKPAAVLKVFCLIIARLDAYAWWADNLQATFLPIVAVSLALLAVCRDPVSDKLV